MTLQAIKKKIVLIGDGAVGKTSLVRKFVYDRFDDEYISTIGTKITKKNMELEQDETRVALKLIIWDILGQKEYKRIRTSSFKGCTGALAVCDCTRDDTLQSLDEYWIPALKKQVGDVPIILLINKTDLKDERTMNEAEIKLVADKYEVQFVDTSAKTGKGVESGFNKLGILLAKKDGIFEDEEEEEEEEQAENPLMDALDMIITDFCESYGSVEDAMPVIRQQFNIIGIDIKNPAKEDIKKLLDALEWIEKGFKDPNTVANNKRRRWQLIGKITA